MKRKEIENRRSKPVKILTLFMNILQIISLAFLVYSVSLIGKIETRLIILGVLIAILINFVSIYLLRRLTKKNKLIKIIIFILISLLFIGIQAYAGYFVKRTYSSLDKANKNEITYESKIITMKETKIKNIKDLKNKSIGIVLDKTSIDGYIIPQEIIDNNSLNNTNEIAEYNTLAEMMKDLYANELDVAFVPSNYTSMLKSIDKYKSIEDETKVIYKKEKTYTKKEIEKITGNETTNTSSKGKLTEPFTVLIMGIDSTENTLDKNATGNGDALMILTFNPKTLNATVWNIPRDTYVPIACFANQKENKITHAAWGGESCMIKTIQNFTGINIDYYVKINFKGVVKIVDALGGITIDVSDEMDGVCEQDSNRSFANQQCFKKGKMNINGEQALAYARHRKTLALGDFQRGLNQQAVVQGILNKLKAVRSTSKALEILDAISDNIDTNFTTDQILSFYDIAKVLFTTSSNDNNIINLQQLYLMGTGQMIYDESIGLELYNFIPNQSSLDQIVDTMNQNLGKSKVPEKSKTMDFNIEEKYEMKIIGRDNLSSTSTYKLLPSVVGKDVEQARSTLQALGLSVVVEEKEFVKSSGYTNGQVLEQSYPEGKRVDLISGAVKLVVAKITDLEEKEEAESGFTNISINIADSVTIDATNGETYTESDAGVGTGSISAEYNGVDITSEININVTYSNSTVTSSTPQLGTYTAEYTATYNGETITTKTKTIIIK